MNTKPNTTAALILAALETNPRTAKEIGIIITKSESVVRENITKLLADGSVQKIGVLKPQMYALTTPAAKDEAEAPAVEEGTVEPIAKARAKRDAKAKQPKKVDVDSGRGDLTVKSGANLHSQGKINRKVKICGDNDSSIVYVRATKNWKLVTPRGTEILTCRCFAAFSFSEWEAYVKAGTRPSFLDESDDEESEESAA